MSVEKQSASDESNRRAVSFERVVGRYVGKRSRGSWACVTRYSLVAIVFLERR